MNKKITLLLSLGLLTQTSLPVQSPIDTIIVDIAVFLVPDSWQIFKEELNTFFAIPFVGAAWNAPKLLQLKSNMNDMFSAAPAQKSHFKAYQPEIDGQPLPQALAEWLRGTKTNQQTLQELLQTNSKYPFGDEKTRQLSERILNAVLNPKKLAQYTKLNKKMMNLYKKICKKFGKKVYVMSNYQAETLNELIKKSDKDDFFKRIPTHHIWISGEHKLLLPDPRAYEHMIKKYNLKPGNCLCINSEIHIVEGARKSGMYAIHCDGSTADAQQLEDGLSAFGINF